MKSRVFAWVLMLLIAGPAFAAETQKEGASGANLQVGEPYGVSKAGTPVRKLQRGFLNIVLAPFEISSELDKVKKRDDALPSWFEGMGRGIWFTSGRALVGVYELLTFPVPAPAGYEPVIKPEFAWDLLPPAAETGPVKR